MTADVSPGRYSLSADLADSAGQCTVSLEASAGETYYFEVTPNPINSGTLVAGMLLGPIGAVVADNIANHGKECGGTFSIAPISKEAGVAALPSLRLTTY